MLAGRNAPLGDLGDRKGLTTGWTDNHRLLFWSAEELFAARARVLTGRGFLGQAIGGHRSGNLAQVDDRAAALGTAVQRGVGRFVIEVAGGAIDEDGRVPELEPVRAAPVRTGKKHQPTRRSFLSRSAARRRVSIFLGKE